MRLNLEQLKKLADAKPDNIIEALKVDGLTMIEAWKQLPLLISRIEDLEKALDEISNINLGNIDVAPEVFIRSDHRKQVIIARKALEGSKE